MGENDKLGFTCEEVPFDFSTFNRFFGATTPWVDEGSSVVPKVPINSIYSPMSPSPLKEDSDFKLLSEETAQAFEKSCNDYLETLSEVSKSLNPCLERLIAKFGETSKRKARKHYKPKFTL